MCAAPNSLRLACGLRSCVNKAQNSHLPEFGAARQPHGRPGALVPLGAAHRRVGAAQHVRGSKLAPAGMRPVHLCQQGPEQSPACFWRGAAAARPAGRACAAWRQRDRAWAPPRECAATNSLRLACGLCGAAQMHQNTGRPKAGATQQPHDEPGARRNRAGRAPLGVGAAEQRASPPSRRLCGPAEMRRSSHLRESGAMQQPHGEPGARRNHALRARPLSAAHS